MKIVALGDSITEGYPYSTQESWVEYVNEVHPGIYGYELMGKTAYEYIKDFFN